MGALESATRKVQNSEELRELIDRYRPVYAEYAAAKAAMVISAVVTLGTIIPGLMAAERDENWTRIRREVRYLTARILEHFTREEFEAYFPGHLLVV